MTKSEIEQLQKNLVALGYDLGRSGENRDGADGFFGNKTRTAIDQLGREINVLFEAPGEPSTRLMELIDLLADADWHEIQGAADTDAEPISRQVQLPYLNTPLSRSNAPTELAKAAQRHLRQLGYLKRGIDGAFGRGTERAVRSLQFDLLYTDDRSKGAPVSIQGYNQSRVARITGRIDDGTAECIQEMLNDPRFPLLPSSPNPAAENAKINALTSDLVPMPYLRQILRQESDLRQFEVPSGKDEDSFIVIGLDQNDSVNSDHITSRGYGAGQYTLFHHPPTPAEVSDFMLDIAANVKKAAEELRGKFDKYVNGRTGGTRADDRIAEFGGGALRVCKYAPDDPRHLTDCRQCMLDAGETDIVADQTPFHQGTSSRYHTTQYHKTTRLKEVPIRANVGCDWPYAIRRYNGSGVNSYWYQSKVLLRIKSE
jgi:peptidoglycan hydrolase-like protein with peptidoglycan-binding domain